MTTPIILLPWQECDRYKENDAPGIGLIRKRLGEVYEESWYCFIRVYRSYNDNHQWRHWTHGYATNTGAPFITREEAQRDADYTMLEHGAILLNDWSKLEQYKLLL